MAELRRFAVQRACREQLREAAFNDPAVVARRNAATDLVLLIFRLNGSLVMAGDRFLADIGLSTARWQVLGAVAMAPRPQPFAEIARTMGLSRQSVRRTAMELVHDGLLALKPNAQDRRAQLVVLTEAGAVAHRAALAQQTPWVERFVEGIPLERLLQAAELLRTLSQQVGTNCQAHDQAHDQ